MKIASAYLYIGWPSAEDRASHTERISVIALHAEMELPILQFGRPEVFSTLVEPHAYTVVTAEHPDNLMRLSLASKTRIKNPSRRTFEAQTVPYSVVVADAAICGNIWDQHVLAALRALNVPLTAPDTPLAHSLISPGGPQQYGACDAQVRADKAF